MVVYYNGDSRDNYFYNTYNDVLSALGDGGNDTLIGNYYYGYNDTLSGGDGNDYLYGYGGNDYISGGANNDVLVGDIGNDTLDGGTGYDAMYGGTGNDIYAVDSVYDAIIEELNQGIDTVYASESYTLGNNLEYLVLTNSAYYGYGNSLDNAIYGNNISNYLYGDAGNDLLVAGDGNDTIVGGTGYDLMYGEDGDDVYFVDSAADSIAEEANQGLDYVSSSISYTLGNNLEYLFLTDSAYYGYGNSLDNVILGNDIDNVLNGFGGNDYLDGGNGNDYIDGSAGNDTILGNNGNDYLIGYFGGSTSEYDYFTGGLGGDMFVLGNASGAFYQESASYAVITDYAAAEGDLIQLYGNANNYSLSYSNHNLGTSAVDTAIYYGAELIAFVQDTTTINFWYA